MAKTIKVIKKQKCADFSDALTVNRTKYYCVENKQELDGTKKP